MMICQQVGIACDRTTERSDMNDTIVDIDDLRDGAGCTGADHDEPSRRDRRRIGRCVEESPRQARVVDRVQIYREVQLIRVGHVRHLPVTRRALGHNRGCRVSVGEAAPTPARVR